VTVSNMTPQRRQRRLILVLLSVAGLLWLLAGLYFARVSPAFLWLGKRIGTPTELVLMSLGPIVAAWLGWRLLQAGQSKVLAWVAIVAGLVSTVAFTGLVAVPMIEKARTPGTPKNPSTPRPLPVMTGLPVFPGAEGFGTRTPAGRGGKVLFVTSLEDSGPGTLREALAQSFPRTILFRVGGTIELRTHLMIAHPFVTVAGQTAPGDGICLKNAGLIITTHDVLVQHLRIRPGNEGRVDADTNDALQLLGRAGDIQDGASNVVVDHCSLSWSEDEVINAWYGAHDITISNCLISEALHRSRHRKATHSAGPLFGDGSYHVTLVRSLMAHNGFRNPLISDGGTHDVVNNVIYDWGNLATQIQDGDANTFVNVIGNTYIPGPSTEPGAFEVIFTAGGKRAHPKIHLAGNIGPHRPSADLDEWALFRVGWEEQQPDHAPFRAEQPFPTWPVTVQPATGAYEFVLANAGATLPRRDAVDRRIAQQVRDRTGRIIDSPKQVGGYPPLSGGEAPADSDQDGLPDDWERRMNLDPNDPADAGTDRDGDGYTNLEEYLHSLLRREHAS
jgi:pectate lyase